MTDKQIARVQNKIKNYKKILAANKNCMVGITMIN